MGATKREETRCFVCQSFGPRRKVLGGLRLQGLSLDPISNVQKEAQLQYLFGKQEEEEEAYNAKNKTRSNFPFTLEMIDTRTNRLSSCNDIITVKMMKMLR